MRKIAIICAAVFALSLPARSQDLSAFPDTASATPSPSPAPSPGFSLDPADREPWQIEMGYQYQHMSLLGQKFHTNGYHTDVVRYISNWYGLEGTAAMGFGNTGGTIHRDAKSLFLGGGPRLALYSNRRFEPWAHALVGWEHFRFTQSSILGSNSALGFMAGGGVDYKIGTNLSWRIQADFLGSHFGNVVQKNYSFGSGFVLNF
jgi:hypothetical protein